jgi:FkbH-like protein
MDKKERRLAGKLKKAIIFDCDDTLWQGVIGEEVVHPDWQIRDNIIYLAKRGVIIGICSKNNEHDPIAMLKGMGLWDDYISVYRINWKDKVSNLKEIAEELNIGLDAIVMVDDSLYEVNMIDGQLPEVVAIFPEDLMDTVAQWFDLTGDLGKTQQYKENYNRAKYQEQFTDINDYLASLDMVLSIKVNDMQNIPRIAELTQKTNQFNLTTKRYSEEDMYHIMNCVYVYSLSVKDRFGDNGLTGVCIVSNGVIDTFLLSCRILGRGIEFAFMDYIIKDLMRCGGHGLIGEYVPSDKNEQVRYFYCKCGFECINVTKINITFELSFRSYKSIANNHFKYE